MAKSERTGNPAASAAGKDTWIVHSIEGGQVRYREGVGAVWHSEDHQQGGGIGGGRDAGVTIGVEVGVRGTPGGCFSSAAGDEDVLEAGPVRCIANLDDVVVRCRK